MQRPEEDLINNNLPLTSFFPFPNNFSSLSKSKIEELLHKLKNAKQMNLMLQSRCRAKYQRVDDKIKKINALQEKIKRVTKSKPKKHIKYPSYAPLEHIYFYTSKKIHIYYHLLDSVINSSKKCQNEEIVLKKDMNRFKFDKNEDSFLSNLLFIEQEPYDWFKFSEELNKFPNQKDKVFTPVKCYVRSLETGSFYKYKKWTKDEDSILKKAILYYGPKNWQQISYCLDGRNNSQCFHRWMKGINPKIKRDKWTCHEDLTLGIALTKIYGFKKWSKIANHLPGRTDIQCRERWCNILDPSLEEVEWTKEEDIKLLNLNNSLGNRWSLIAKEYGNRTDNTCWRRWKFLTGNVGMTGRTVQKDEAEKKKKNEKVLFKVTKAE